MPGAPPAQPTSAVADTPSRALVPQAGTTMGRSVDAEGQAHAPVDICLSTRRPVAREARACNALRPRIVAKRHLRLTKSINQSIMSVTNKESDIQVRARPRAARRGSAAVSSRAPAAISANDLGRRNRGKWPHSAPTVLIVHYQVVGAGARPGIAV